MIEWLPEWLFEGQFLVYAILIATLIFMGIVWKQTPRRAYAVTVFVLVGLIALYCLLDFLVETDHEQITHAISEMSAGVQAKDVNRIFDSVSKDYNRHGLDKDGFRQMTSSVITGNIVDRVAIWGYDFAPDYKEKSSPSDARENIAHVNFMAKPVGGDKGMTYLIKAVMRRDADGKWRMQSWEAYDAYHESKEPLHVPYLN
jgi:ketosteroid isomerase-like protein